MTRWSLNHYIDITRERNSWFRNDRPAKIWGTKERPYIQNESLCNVLRLMLRKTQMIRTIPLKMKWKKAILMKLLRQMKIPNFSMFQETASSADTAKCHSESSKENIRSSLFSSVFSCFSSLVSSLEPSLSSCFCVTKETSI